MKMMKQTAMVMTCLFALGMGSSLAAANEQAAQPAMQKLAAAELQINPEIMQAPAMQHMYGKITAINGSRVTVKSLAREFTVDALLSEATYIIQGEQGKLRRPTALQVGQMVTVYHSSRMTRSLPPQAQAFAIVIGEQRQNLPLYFEVADLVQAEDGQSVRVLNSTHNIIATVDKNACKDYDKIRKGDKLLIWCSVMTMSLPGQTNAQKAVILP